MELPNDDMEIRSTYCIKRDCYDSNGALVGCGKNNERCTTAHVLKYWSLS